MFCTNCGQKSNEGEKFCTNCGNSISIKKSSHSEGRNVKNTPFLKRMRLGDAAKVIIGLAIVGFIIYANIDESSVENNNQGLASFESGDSDSAIRHLEEASGSATRSDTKLSTLKNLGYVYATEGKIQDARRTFSEALTYTKTNSLDSYLVQGEIDYLDGNFSDALGNFNKAYEINPNDFQVNNSLNLFYLDLEGVIPEYADYSQALVHAKKAYGSSESAVKNTAGENLAIAYFFNEDFNSAINYFKEADTNNDPYIDYWLAWSYAALEDVANAKLHFQRAIDGGVELEPEAYDYINYY